MALHSDWIESVSSLTESASRCVLVVDDENGVRDLMSRWLEAGGYSVASASGADEALGVIQTFVPAVALCDLRMPGRDGLWLAQRIRRQCPETAVIIATGVHDPEEAVSTVTEGVVDCLSKPFGRDRLRDAVVRGMEWHRTARDSRCWRERLDLEIEVRRTRLADAIAALDIDSDEALDTLMSRVTMGEQDAYAHARRVASLAVNIARAVGLTDDEIAIVRRGAMLHDLGKLAMPEALLRKPAPLSSDEQAVMRRYTELGAELIADVAYLEEAAEIVRDFQERPDGKGYPAALCGNDIPLAAQIVAAADAYDTMTRPRAFRAPLNAADALLELDRSSGTQFDPHIVRVLKRLVATH
jgi:putative nucleotidyltransferase with HDIG domain